MGAELRIDPEFRDKIPPLTDDEFKQLRENILDAGEVYEPIAVWNGTIIDGHNRYKVIQEHPEITWRVREMHFDDKWAAFDWMYRNQLGRRNLTDEQRTYMIGKMYEARKKSRGNTTELRNPDGTYQSGQSDAVGKKTRELIAEELGIGAKTVERSEKFAKGVDAIRGVNPDAADKVLGGKADVNKRDVMAVTTMARDEVKAVAQAILDDTKPEKPVEKPKNNGRSAESRELFRIISEANAELEDSDRPDTFDIDDMIRLIKANGQNYINVLTLDLSTKKHLLTDDESKRRVFEAIAEIIQNIVKVRGEYTK